MRPFPRSREKSTVSQVGGTADRTLKMCSGIKPTHASVRVQNVAEPLSKKKVIITTQFGDRKSFLCCNLTVEFGDQGFARFILFFHLP